VKRLIVNADDLGADEARNAGIFEAAAAGAITSVSLLATGLAFEDAARRLRSLPEGAVSIGIHLDLSEGQAVSSGLARIADRDGRFFGKAGAMALLLRENDALLEEEILREFDAQIRRVKEAGLETLHLDGHQHVHVFPGCVDAAITMARRHGIPWIRIPDEEDPSADSAPPLHPGAWAEADRFRCLGRAARSRLSGSGLRAPDHFRGLFLKNALTIERLDDTLALLPDGLTELMVHPGRVPRPDEERGPFSAFSTPEREAELTCLLDERFSRTIDAFRIERIPFPRN